MCRYYENFQSFPARERAVRGNGFSLLSPISPSRAVVSLTLYDGAIPASATADIGPVKERAGIPVNSLFAVINLMMARTASTYGGHIGLMTMTAGGQIEAIAWNTSQGFSTALSTFVAQNFAARKKERVLGAYHTTLKMTALFGIFCTLLFVFFGSEVFSPMHLPSLRFFNTRSNAS